MAETANRALRLKEASERLGVGLSTLYSYSKDGRIKLTKLSPKVTVILESDLNKFMEQSAAPHMGVAK